MTPSRNKIEEGIETIRKNCYPASIQVADALETLIELAQSYLKFEGSGIVPEEKIILIEKGKNFADIWNDCRHEVIIRMRGMEEKIFSFLKTYKELECIDECYLERLATAILNLLTSGEKEK